MPLSKTKCFACVLSPFIEAVKFSVQYSKWWCHVSFLVSGSPFPRGHSGCTLLHIACGIQIWDLKQATAELRVVRACVFAGLLSEAVPWPQRSSKQDSTQTAGCQPQQLPSLVRQAEAQGEAFHGSVQTLHSSKSIHHFSGWPCFCC